ncbi:MAG: FHA domain-containing protein [Kiritimatiellaeota bacterium]|nr:FHA domain-containing protein [Kiritimatiellota bacterium]
MSIFTHLLVFERGARAGRRLPFTPPQMTLGRASQCDIAIADPLLSRAHCRFEMRDGHLWVVDLESANETLVNGAPITEQSLLFGDVVTVGDSTIRIARAEEAAPAPAADEHAVVPADVVIDLGFDKPDDGALPKKNFLRPLIWAIAAILVLVAGTTFIFESAREEGAATVTPMTVDTTLQVYYEKVDASAENIFRYEMALNADGLMAIKVDDLSGNGRHIEEKKTVAKEMLAELARDIESSGFFALDKSYSGYTLDANALNESHLVIAVGKKVHACRTKNRSDEPEGFRNARDLLETFGKNELGLWPIELSAEKLIELAEDALSVARKRYAEREVRYGNLFEALRNYKDALTNLDTVNPKPEFYTEILEGFETAKKEIEDRYKDQSFLADRAMRTSDWPTAQRELKIICELIPDRSDPRHTQAMRKLIDVERRIRK